jgi:transcription initiation factor IIE alpha subunit
MNERQKRIALEQRQCREMMIIIEELSELRNSTDTTNSEPEYAPLRIAQLLKSRPWHVFHSSDIASELKIDEREVQTILVRLYIEDAAICRGKPHGRNQWFYYSIAELEGTLT